MTFPGRVWNSRATGSSPGRKKRPLEHPEMLRHWLRVTREAVFVADIRGRILDANPAFLQLTGLALNSKVGNPDLPGLLTDPAQWHVLRQRLKGGSARDQELSVSTSKGQRRFRLCASPFVSDRSGRKLFVGSLIEVEEPPKPSLETGKSESSGNGCGSDSSDSLSRPLHEDLG